MQHTSDPQFHKWNEYLLNELTASETYKEAAEKVKDELVRDQLQQCEISHRNRAQKLESGLQDLGIESGVQPQIWNSFASLLAEGAFKDKDAVQLLEGEEEIGLQTYQDDNAHLGDHDPLRDLLQSTLLPEQSNTHDALNILRLSLS
jgi:hypothetical protein